MNTRLQVSETMRTDPATADNDPSIQEAAMAMRDRDAGCLVLLDGTRIKGLVTERDIVTKVVAEGLDPATTNVSSCMATELVTITPDDDILTALRLMRRHHIRRLPVLQDDELVGLITERGISAVAPELIQIAEDWQHIAHPEDNPGAPAALDSIRIEGRCETCGNDDQNLHEAEGTLLCEECLDAQEGDSETTVVSA